MTPNEILAGLANFHGTEQYYRHSHHAVVTDGVKWLADHAQCYWLIDVIASHLPTVPTDEYFCVVLLTKGEGGAAYFELTNDRPPSMYYATQVIEYTDIVLEEVKLYCGKLDDSTWAVMLPGEY